MYGRSGETASEGVNGIKEAESMRVKDERRQEVRRLMEERVQKV